MAKSWQGGLGGKCPLCLPSLNEALIVLLQDLQRNVLIRASIQQVEMLIRPDKLDVLFCIRHLLDSCVGRWSFFAANKRYMLGKSMALWPLKVAVSLILR